MNKWNSKSVYLVIYNFNQSFNLCKVLFKINV